MKTTSRRVPFGVNGLRAEVETWFRPERLNVIMGPASSDTEEVARQWLAKAGKRWRPLLAAGTFRAVNGCRRNGLPPDLQKLAVAVECFHKASLAHDDIEDHDTRRYGVKTLHAEYDIPIALNAGDLLVGEGYRLIGEADAVPAQKAAMLRVAAAGHRDLCIGQGRELFWARHPVPLSPAQVLDIFRGKTVPAFRVALRLGSIFAGVDGAVSRVLDRYSEHLGIAYQIRDDLADFWNGSRKAAGTGPMLLLAMARAQSKGTARALIDRAWRAPTTREARRALRGTVGARRTREQAVGIMESSREEAHRCLRPLASDHLKSFLSQVVNQVFQDA